MNPIVNNLDKKSKACSSPQRRGFTLIELLVVLAITSILFLLVFKPLIASFDLTSRASTQIESQADARDVMRKIADTISNATYIPDNTNTPINLYFYNSSGVVSAIPVNFGMLEYVLPAREGENSAGATLDPTTDGPYQPGGAGANFVTPLAPGRELGRIFLGLRNNASLNGKPVLPYGNRWEDPSTVSPTQDNRYNLYRAEVTTRPITDTSPKLRPNWQWRECRAMLWEA